MEKLTKEEIEDIIDGLERFLNSPLCVKLTHQLVMQAMNVIDQPITSENIVERVIEAKCLLTLSDFPIYLKGKIREWREQLKKEGGE